MEKYSDKGMWIADVVVQIVDQIRVKGWGERN